MARLLAYTYPSRGHLYPLVPTLQELRKGGHDVLLRTMGAELEAMRELGFHADPVDRRLEGPGVDDWRARTPVGAQRREVSFLAARAPIEMSDVRAALPEVDGLLVDTTSWGAQIAAEASGLPWAMVGHFPLPITSRDAPPYGLGLRPRTDRLGRWRDGLARRLILAPLERLVLPTLNALRAEQGLRALRDATDLFAHTAPLVLYYTAEPFEYPRSDWPDSVRLVGPGLWDPPAAAPPWLDEVDRPLVLVTCSSEFQDDGKLAAVAMQALADSPFQVVVTTAAVDPAGFTAPANAQVTRYLPHGPLVQRAACVVCHAGMGVTQKALAAGVPVCAVPFGRDQFEVARRLQVAGAGSVVAAWKLSPERLRRAVQQALQRAVGAQRIARAFAAAGGPAEAAHAVENLLRNDHHGSGHTRAGDR